MRFAAPPPPGSKITQQEVTEYGKSLSMWWRAARRSNRAGLAQVISELNQLKRSVGGVQNTVEYDARVRMYEDLAHDVPNWDAINNSQQFAHWLDHLIRSLARCAGTFSIWRITRNLAGQVIAIFRGFLTTWVTLRVTARLPPMARVMRGSPAV